MSLGVSFETCLRCCGDALMGLCCYVLLRIRHDVQIRCRGDVPLRRLSNVPPRRRWVFHLRRTCDTTGMYREMLLRCRYDVLLPCGKAVDNNSHGSKFVLLCYKTQKMCYKDGSTYLSAIRFICKYYKAQEMCNQAICSCPLVYDSIPDQYMTQEYGIKLFLKNLLC